MTDEYFFDMVFNIKPKIKIRPVFKTEKETEKCFELMKKACRLELFLGDQIISVNQNEKES